MPIPNQCTGARLTMLLLFWSAIAAATEAPTRADECVALVDREARLACYDRAHGRSDEATATVKGNGVESAEQTAPAAPLESSMPTGSAQVDQAAPTAPHAASAAPPSSFGAEQLPRPREARANQDELVAEITAMGRQTTGRHWFRLENGQLWSQISPEHTTLKTGDSVRINRSLLGTYQLRRTDGGSRSSAIRRLE